MVTIIKNQLLKHLSRFTKNLSPEQISVSALRGQGSLCGLQLDEAVLTQLLELPPWLRLSSATCAKASFHVHWTKLKTMPIELNLEDVEVNVETCTSPRESPSSAGPLAGSPALPPQKYSFIHKVIDGISITVNTVKIKFTSPVFIATVQMSRIIVESRTPQWQRGDLRLTRLKDPATSQLLIFKEVSWQSARIEAHAVKMDNGLPPLRLLTNQAHCRITIKKQISDCFVVGSRLVLILEEALWMLTDRQLGAALAFADSLTSIVRNTTAQLTRDKAMRKIQTLPVYMSRGKVSGPTSNKARPTDPLQRLFLRHDVQETSYHFLSQRIDLHLCDDPGPGRSCHPSLWGGAALQVSLQKLQLDYYPYHLASGDRNHWPGYRESAGPHTQWLRQALSTFRGNLLNFLEPQTYKSSNNEESNELPLDPSSLVNPPMSPPHNSTAPAQSSNSPARKFVLQQLSKLMSTCIILRLEDYTLYKVTTGDRKEAPRAFICGDRERFTLPEEVRALHVEFMHFYYPADVQFPVPPPKLYVQVNPVKVTFDLLSCLWCNAFILNLLSCVKNTQVANLPGESDLAYVDVTLEAIMPRVIVDTGKEYPVQRDRPRSLQIQVSRATICNAGGAAGGAGELASCLAQHAASPLLAEACCSDTMLQHAAGEDNAFSSLGAEALRSRALWGAPRTVWCVRLEPVWADFCGARASPSKPTPLLDAVPFTIWVYMNMDDDDKKMKSSSSSYNNNLSDISRSKRNSRIEEKTPRQKMDEELHLEGEADLQIIAQCSQLVSLQLNHYQYLLLLRLMERIAELTAFLPLDSPDSKSMVVGCIIPQVELTLVLPSCCPGKESSRDLDSVLPDSSSLMDLHQNTGSGTLCYQPQGNGSNILSMSSLERHAALAASLSSVGQPHLTAVSSGATLMPNEPADDWQHLGKGDEPPVIPAAKEGLSNINATISSSMRRGLTSLMSSLDAALKPGDAPPGSSSPAAAPSAADQWDTASVASSDSERYVMVQLAQEHTDDAPFRLWEGTGLATEGTVEMAAEVIEHSSSPSERSLASSCRRRDLVSMSTFKLRRVEVFQISKGFCSRVMVNVTDLAVDECPSIPWDELQSKFSSRSRGWTDSIPLSRSGPLKEDMEPKVCVRLDNYPHRHIQRPVDTKDALTLESVMGSLSGLLEVEVKDVDLTLNMSTATGLADLLEDEVLVPPLPLEVFLEGVSIRLNEDRPASSISSPGAVPLRLSLSGLRLLRGVDGIMHLRPAVPLEARQHFHRKPTSDTNSDLASAQRLVHENEALKRRLNALEKLSVENDVLRRSREETDILKACLLTAQDEVAALLDEKTTLLETVQKLQEQASGVEVRGTLGGGWGRSNKR